MYKCAICPRKDFKLKPHVHEEYNISQLCEKCQNEAMSSHYCFNCKIVSKWSDQDYTPYLYDRRQKRIPKCKQCKSKLLESQKVVKCEACNTLCVWNTNINKRVPIDGGLEQCLKTNNNEHILHL